MGRRGQGVVPLDRSMYTDDNRTRMVIVETLQLFVLSLRSTRTGENELIYVN